MNLIVKCVCCDENNVQSGFMLLELIIVVLMIGILVVIVLFNLIDKLMCVKEVVFKQNLWIMCDVFDQYYVDKGKYLSELQEFVEVKYFCLMLIDLIIGSEEMWIVVYEEFEDEEIDDYYEEESEFGIVDVQFGLEFVLFNGEGFYSEW